jgi:uncharacterized sodium:solute symporter family permease YidK
LVTQLAHQAHRCLLLTGLIITNTFYWCFRSA